MKLKTLLGATLAIAFACCVQAYAASAPAFPSKPIRFVVPFAPGGSTDTLARTLGQKISEGLGQQVVIDNRTGANGNIGMEIVANAPPDGHTIVLGYIANVAIGPGESGRRWAWGSPCSSE